MLKKAFERKKGPLHFDVERKSISDQNFHKKKKKSFVEKKFFDKIITSS